MKMSAAQAIDFCREEMKMPDFKNSLPILYFYTVFDKFKWYFRYIESFYSDDTIAIHSAL